MAPRDIEPSSEWAEQIIDGINAANVMVLVFSSWSNQSPQVRREVERAINRDMPVIPFRIEKVLPVKSLEYFLSTQHWFDAFDGRLETHVDQVGYFRASATRLSRTSRWAKLAFLTGMFARADDACVALMARGGDETDNLRALLRGLGNETLAENEDWLTLRRDRPMILPPAMTRRAA